MTEPQIYLIILLFSLLLGFGPWIWMQIDGKREIMWFKIALVGLISTIVTILIGIFLLVNWINNIF